MKFGFLCKVLQLHHRLRGGVALQRPCAKGIFLEGWMLKQVGFF
jgi:hypothetical protein